MRSLRSHPAVCVGIALSLVCAFVPSSFAGSVPTSLIPASGKLATCNFTTGEIHFECIPLYLSHLIKFFIGLSAGFFLTSVILGGYKYAIGSVTTEGKEAGKKQIIAAIIGLSVVVLSYLLVDTILTALTS